MGTCQNLDVLSQRLSDKRQIQQREPYAPGLCECKPLGIDNLSEADRLDPGAAGGGCSGGYAGYAGWLG